MPPAGFEWTDPGRIPWQTTTLDAVEPLVPNRLADATSPYLLQHADNPVDWWEWGDDAFEDARARDVPIFLSVGYSSCHWCHVMAHESFEDEDVAAYLNEHFACVKVDREERPDVDSVYMTATQALTGRGGWPMSVFLDHQGRPFHAGTYWPRRRRGGMPGFPDVLTAVAEAWRDQRDQISESAAAITDQLEQRMQQPAEAGELTPDVLAEATDAIVGAWDRRHGGFGRAPKFPQAMAIGFLLDQHVITGHDQALAAATHSLTAMVRGGIHDQLTGGFARYATDERWLVPHFEKMLYDNALLLGVLADAAALTGDELLSEGAHRTAAAIDDWFEHDSGAFIAATDADSEGEEGKYFTFDHGEAVQVLQEAGLDAERWASFLGIQPGGFWEGTNVLHEAVDRDEFRTAHDLDTDTFERELFEVRSALAAARDERVPPGADDKLLAGWNGLAISGLVTAGDRLARPELYTIAGNALAAVEEHLVGDDGRLHRSWRAGRAGAGGFLEDHAAVADAALALAERTGDLERFAWARRLAEHTLEAFSARDAGDQVLYTTADDAEDLWTRPRDEGDNAVPSGTALLAGVLLRLSALTGDPALRERAEALLATTTGSVRRWPTGFGQTLRAMRWALADQVEVAIVGPPGEQRDALLAAAVDQPRPGRVTFVADVDAEGRVPARAAEAVPLLAGRTVVDGVPAAYVCRQMACRLPVTTPADLRAELDRADT